LFFRPMIFVFRLIWKSQFGD